MSVPWDDLAARARGLAGRLLTGAELESLKRARDLPEALALLARRRSPGGARRDGARSAPSLTLPTGPGERSGPEAVERALRRRAAAWLGLLGRWAGDRVPVLAPLFEAEDRRSLSALLRGAAGGVAPEERTAAALPTPSLPEPALRELARQPSPGAVAALLSTWGDPYGPPLAEAAETAEPRPVSGGADLLRLEAVLGRAWSARALAASRAGGGELRSWVVEEIDLENCWSGLALAAAGERREGGRGEPDPEEVFLAGGSLELPVVSAAAAAEGPGAAAAILAQALPHRPWAPRLVDDAGAPHLLETAVLEARLGALRRRQRLRPVSAAPVLLLLLALRRESRRVREAVWRLALEPRRGREPT
ncbi:MAG: V-type ATPase subunit [Thermoanaerobaculia bacterium]